MGVGYWLGFLVFGRLIGMVKPTKLFLPFNSNYQLLIGITIKGIWYNLFGNTNLPIW